MNKFREVHPSKRENPKAVKHYREYKRDLKEDFHSRCGYCNDSDVWSGGLRFYQLDHFIPKKYLTTISINEYSNLVYSCFFCNNAKRAKWPSKNEDVQFVGNEGFENPRQVDYCNHLSRDKEGNIKAETEIGKYMFKALKLNLKRHAIIWKLEKIEALFDTLESQYIAADAKGNIPHALAIKVASLCIEYRTYTKELRKEQDV